MTKRVLLLTSAFGALALSATAAVAQTAPATADETSNGAVEVGGVTVTAERRSANVQDIPVAVTAITSAVRDQLGIQTIQDITQFTPGLSYNTGNDRSSIRGISRFTNNQASQGAVAIYSDGVYTSSTFEAGKATIFTDRVEVLRGPQGTLYGRNAIGGAINVISRRPSDHWYAEARANVGNYGFTEFSAAVSGPVTDWLRFRLAASKDDQTRGYYRNVQQSSPGSSSEGQVRNEYYVEAQLAFNAGEDFEGWLKVGFREWNNRNGGPGERSGLLAYPYNTAASAASGATNIATSGIVPNFLFGYTGVNPQCPTYTLVNAVVHCSGGDPRSYDANSSSRNTLDNAPTVALELVYHGSGFDVKYMGGYTRYRYGLDFEVDNSSATGTYIYPGSQLPCTGVAAPVASCTGAGATSAGVAISRVGSGHYEEDKEWNSNEINITSTSDGPVRWILGAYQYHDNNYYTPLDVRDPLQTQLSNPLVSYDYCVANGLGIHSPVLGTITAIAGCTSANVGSAINRVAGAANPERRYFYQHFDGGTDSYAGFGQVDWRFREDLTFTAGLRYSYDRTRVQEVFRATCFGTALCTGSASELGAGAFSYDVSGSPFLIDTTNLDPSVVAGTAGMGADGYYHRNLSHSWTALTGVAKLEWRPDNDTLTYVSYTRGYKAGGFNAGLITQIATANPEHVDAYEIGLKRNWGRTFQLNASLFYYNYSDAQAPLRVPTPAGLVTNFTNIPAVRNLGLELETIWSPVPQFQLIANYALLDTRITSSGCYVDPVDTLAVQPEASPGGCPIVSGSQTQNLNGARMPSSPLNRLTVNANYTFHLDPGNLTLSATWAYRSSTYYDIFNRDYTRAPAYSQTDLRATFTDRDNRYSVILYGRNIFDELGYIGTASPGRSTIGIGQTIGLTPPRTFGAELQYRFF